jgi:anhydro-N-acetylmuramic acid kinase
VLDTVLSQVLRQPFFRRPPPKTAGREEFGREFVAAFLRRCRGASKEDILATATALTARSIAGAVRMFLVPGVDAQQFFQELIVSGGGARNRTLLDMLRRDLPVLKLRTSDQLGLPAEAKEAVAFAILAYQTWHRLPSNIPAATGAERGAVLGKVSYP